MIIERAAGEAAIEDDGRFLISDRPVENPAVLRVTPRAVDLEALKTTQTARAKGFRNAASEDVSRVLRGNWLVYDESRQEVVVAYLRPPGDDLKGLVPYLHQIQWVKAPRPDGSPSTAKTVGWQDESRIRQRDVCTFSKIHRETPEAGAAVLSYGVHACQWYQSLDPEKYAHHQELTRHILPRYHLRDTPFTSAIVNKDNVLPYHFDRGNVAGSWSLMLGYKHNVDGGHLVIPELDLALEVEDGSISCFDGQIALHGVTPFRRTGRVSWRYTIVYYAKAGMWRCLPTDEQEVKKGQIARTRKEINRWKHDKGEPTDLRERRRSANSRV